MKKLLSGLIMVLFCCGMIADENGQKNSINLMSNGIIEQGGGSFPDFWIKYGQYTPGYNPYGYKGKGVFVFDKPGIMMCGIWRFTVLCRRADTVYLRRCVPANCSVPVNRSCL